MWDAIVNWLFAPQAKPKQVEGKYYIYVISNPDSKCGMYKVGLASQTTTDLICRYQTYIPQCKILYTTKGYTKEKAFKLETDIHKIYEKYLIKNSSGRPSEWIRRDPNEIIETIKRLQRN